MPRLFCRDFYDDIAERVVLSDMYNNQIEVQVLKTKGSIYLISGWLQLRVLYNLTDGGWIWFQVYSKSQLLIEVRQRWMVEVCYPQPPKHLKLSDINVVPVVDINQVINSILI